MWILAASATAHAAVPIAFGDGDTHTASGPVVFGLVGGFAGASPETEADVASADLMFLVLAGDAVPRGSRRAWAALQARLPDVPIVPLAGVGEGRGDRALTAFAEAWTGLGVAGLDLAVPWRSFDVRSGDSTWRFVVLDAEADRPGTRFQDQTSWVPKAVADGDAPLILLSNQPVRSLSAAWRPEQSAGAAVLHEVVRRHSGPSRIALLAAGGTATPEFVLPGGPWGEGWLGVGRTDGPAATLRRTHEPLALEPGLDAALGTWFVANGRPAPTLTDDYRAEIWPVEGWWRVTLDGAELRATLRMCGPACSDVYTVSWSRAGGWRYPTR